MLIQSPDAAPMESREGRGRSATAGNGNLKCRAPGLDVLYRVAFSLFAWSRLMRRKVKARCRCCEDVRRRDMPALFCTLHGVGMGENDGHSRVLEWVPLASSVLF